MARPRGGRRDRGGADRACCRWPVGASGSSGSAAPGSRRTRSSRVRGEPRSAAGTGSRRRTCGGSTASTCGSRPSRSCRTAGRPSSRARTRRSPGTRRAEFLAELVSLRRVDRRRRRAREDDDDRDDRVRPLRARPRSGLARRRRDRPARRQRRRGGGLARRRGGRVRPHGRAAAARDRRRHERRARPPFDVRRRRPRWRRCSTRWLAEVPQVVRGWELEPVSFELRAAG